MRVFVGLCVSVYISRYVRALSLFIEMHACRILGRVHTARRLFGTVTFALNGIINGLVMAFAMFIVYPVGSYQALAGILPLVAGLAYSGYFSSFSLSISLWPSPARRF